MNAVPLWFGPEDRPLFGWLHWPEDGMVRGAVVLCPPLGRERTSAHSTMRLLAEGLAETGLAALRFDYDGTGDSAGSDRDPERLQAWIESTASAVELCRRSGARSVALVGMRMGALIAGVSLPRAGDIEAMVLWDPCRSGRAFLRQQSALQRLRLVTALPPEDGVELPGYTFSAPTVEDLSNLAPVDIEALGERVMLLERPGARERRDGVAVAEAAEVVEVEGQDQLLDVETLRQVIPVATIDRIIGWLGARFSGTSSRFSPERRDTAVMRTENHSVIERLVSLGPVGLFGIEASTARSRDAPPILMLNTGNDWHAGPNRLWVELSRQWASLGFRCVRFDESGLGDSPTRPGCARHVVRLPEAFEDVEDAAAAVSPNDPDEVVLVGLCSGAYQALEHALRHRPRVVCAVNPVLHFHPPEATAGQLDHRRRICRPMTVAVRAYRRLTLDPVRRALRTPLWRLVQFLEGRRSPHTWLEELSAHDIRVLVIGGDDELRPILEAARGKNGRQLDLAGVDLEVMPGLDHGLMVAAQRRAVSDRLTRFLVDAFPGTEVGPTKRAERPVLQSSHP